MDNRDFDMRKIPGIEAMIASGVPESCSLADQWDDIEELRRQRDEAREVVTKLNDLNEGLLTTIDQLRSERDEAREVLLARKDALMFFEGLTQRLLEERRAALRERDEWHQKAEHLERETIRLRAALEQYGEHDEECPLFGPHLIVDVCSCGLASVLEEAKETPGSEEQE